MTTIETANQSDCLVCGKPGSLTDLLADYAQTRGAEVHVRCLPAKVDPFAGIVDVPTNDGWDA